MRGFWACAGPSQLEDGCPAPRAVIRPAGKRKSGSPGQRQQVCKYEGVQSVAFAQSVDPMFLTSETCTWVPPPGTTPAMMPTNGVAIVAASTFTKCTGFNGSVGTHLGPTVKCPYSWECTVQQEIMPQFVVSVGYYHRQNRNNLGIANSLVPSSDYTPYTITNRSMDLL